MLPCSPPPIGAPAPGPGKELSQGSVCGNAAPRASLAAPPFLRLASPWPPSPSYSRSRMFPFGSLDKKPVQIYVERKRFTEKFDCDVTTEKIEEYEISHSDSEYN